MTDRGSIFIETLIAAAILAMILGATFEILQDSALRARRIGGQREAMLIAQSRLAEYPLTHAIRPGRRRGQEMGYRWEVDVAAAARPLPSGAMMVRVVVVLIGDRSIGARLMTLRPGEAR